MAATSLSVTVAHAVAYLTKPLAPSYPSTTIIKLQLVLEADLTALFAPTWVPQEPIRGSGRRCLSLSPNCLPPRVIYNACIATGVQWFDWIALLGGREFDFFIDPGCISTRVGKKGSQSKPFIVWSDKQASTTRAAPVPVMDEERIQAQVKAQADARARAQGKTLAQQLLEEDDEDDETLFAMIADEVTAPTWITPILDQFPAPRSTSPLSAISNHSRSSSRSSNSSSGFSFTSSETADSYGSYSSLSTLSTSPSDKVLPKQSRRERARQARVFIDTTKNEVTPYDGGKTTVLTGGVMLGASKAAPSAPKAKTATRPVPIASNWRTSFRA